ncbi:hypothetical protein GRF29_44g128841 [Pseudopithomyces chartarum]|uniref:Autophagy-related protein n=1 Tax=Pseudopithomyces chartarum TaxID=1892770 RepID=A0AAN6LXJ7_9PLEO|nr:hypothetical protein GRF29_44g128841 [Pseudopithomyces chartarum]
MSYTDEILGPYRKRLLLTFAYTGATFCALFLFLTSRIYYLAPLLVIISVTCLGSGFSLLNAFLPLLVANDPSNRNPPPSTSASVSTYELDEVASPPSNHSSPQKTTQDLDRSSRISSKGVGLGYASAVLFQLFAILLLLLFSKLDLARETPRSPSASPSSSSQSGGSCSPSRPTSGSSPDRAHPFQTPVLLPPLLPKVNPPHSTSRFL